MAKKDEGQKQSRIRMDEDKQSSLPVFNDVANAIQPQVQGPLADMANVPITPLPTQNTNVSSRGGILDSVTTAIFGGGSGGKDGVTAGYTPFDADMADSFMDPPKLKGKNRDASDGGINSATIIDAIGKLFGMGGK